MKKRRDVFNYLHKRKYDICLLQETHCTKEQENKWQNEWGYKAYFSSYRGNSRGVAILINNTFEFKLHNAVSDQDGRFIVLDCTIRDVNLYIANIYAPNDDDPIFFDMVKNKQEQRKAWHMPPTEKFESGICRHCIFCSLYVQSDQRINFAAFTAMG